MSIPKLHDMVCQAVLSDTFRTGILNGRRAELLGKCGLEPDEIAEIMAIRANTLEEFSAALLQIIHTREAALRRAPGGGMKTFGEVLWLRKPLLLPAPPEKVAPSAEREPANA